MRTPTKQQKRARAHVQARTPAAGESTHGILERWRQRTAARKRRVLVQWLRRTAIRAREPDPAQCGRRTLLHYRAAAVHAELLETAALLECASDPHPASMAKLHDLLANGCDSPLYNADIHVSELRATLYSVCKGFETEG